MIIVTPHMTPFFYAFPKARRPFCDHHCLGQFTTAVNLGFLGFGVFFGSACSYLAAGAGAVGALPYSGLYRVFPGLRVRGGFGIVDLNFRHCYCLADFLMGLLLLLYGLRLLLPGCRFLDLRFLSVAFQHLTLGGAARI